MAKLMKRNLGNLATTIFSRENMPKSFYVLALVPSIVMYYFSIQSSTLAAIPIGLAIPLYGFAILLLKRRKLFSHKNAGPFQKLVGLTVILSSFFVYFAVSPFFPDAAVYGFANYSLYIIGLFLVFFQVQALKEAFSPLFLVAAFLASSFASDLAESLFTSFIPQLTSFIAAVLRILGIAATYSAYAPNTIVLNTTEGAIPLIINWACVGFTSIYVFSIILVLIMSEDPTSIRTKLIWSAIGILGTFLVAVIRLITVFVGFYSLGSAYGQVIHRNIGYVLFVVWTVIFLYSFSRRNSISRKISRICEMVQRLVVQDKSLLSTIALYSTVLVIFANLQSIRSTFIGLMMSTIYLAINARFLGNAFFNEERALLRLTFGILLLVMLLGFVGWLVLIIHNLNIEMVTLVLLLVATTSSLLNLRVKDVNAPK